MATIEYRFSEISSVKDGEREALEAIPRFIRAAAERPEDMVAAGFPMPHIGETVLGRVTAIEFVKDSNCQNDGLVIFSVL